MGSWVAPLLAGVSALGGALGLGKQSTTSKVNNTTTTTPMYDPTNLKFRDSLISKYFNTLEDSGNFEGAYKTAGLNNIVRTNNMGSNAFEDALTSRGINNTTAGGYAAGANIFNRGNKTADFLNNLPLLFDARNRDLMGEAARFQSSIPVPTSVHQEGTVANMGGPPSGFLGAAGGAATGLATYLGQLSAQQSLQNALKSLYPSGGSYSSFMPNAQGNYAGGGGG